jgi:hypothetical protein
MKQMFCSFITKESVFIFQYSETNVMHFIFCLLRIKGHYMFRELLADSQGSLRKWHLVYCVRVMSVRCTRYTKCRCEASPEDEKVMLETCRGP